MTETVFVSGLKELQAQLRAIAAAGTDKDAAKPVSAALRKAAVVVQKSAKSILESGGHVKTGTLLNNIIVYKKKSPAGVVSYGVSIRAKAKKYKDTARNRRAGKVGGKYKDLGPLFYARFLEFGTSHQGAAPFLGPAFDFNQNELPEIFVAEMNKRLDAIK